MLLELSVILVLIVLNGIFAAAEIAVVGFERARLAHMVAEGSRGARAVETLRTDPERFFATVQIVITVVGATAGAFGGATLARDLTPLLRPLLGDAAYEVAIACVIGLVSTLSLVVGELVPKSLALRRPERYALLIAPLLLKLAAAVRPLVWLLTKSSNAVLALFGDKTNFAESRLSSQELRHLVQEATESGSLDPGVGEIASRAIDFEQLTAADVMVPRTRIVGIPTSARMEALRQIVLEQGYSRLPVYDGDLDDIVGYVLYKDLLALAWENRLFVLQDLVRPVLTVVEYTPASELLQRMRHERNHLAVVIDERGGVAGIVSFDDLVEELVGEVLGERHQDAPASIRPEADGSIVVAAHVAIRDLNRQLDLELPELEGFSSVGGLCLSLAGDVPESGEVFLLEDGTELRVVRASDRAVELVQVVPREAG